MADPMKNMKTLTHRGVDSLKPGPKRYVAWVENRRGLGVRVAPSGVKTFVFAYHLDGFKWQTLGRFPGMTVQKALEAYTDADALRSKRTDPIEAKEKERREEREAEEARRIAEELERKQETVTQLAELYLKRWARPRKRTAAEDERLLRKNVLPYWGTRKAKDITRRDVIALLDRLQARGLGVGCNRVLAVVRKMFRFGMERDLVDASPCEAVRAPLPEHRRDRVLQDQEISAFWAGLEEAKSAPQMRLALRFALVTAQRIGEVLGATWEEMDEESGWWTLAAERMKSKRPHRVPLSPLALRLLREAKLISAGSAYVFPSPKHPKRPMRVASASRVLLENRAIFQELGVSAPFVPHDLRRTAASKMTALGAMRLIVSKLLNHAEVGVTSIYDRFEYSPEKVKATGKWSAELERLIGRSWTNRGAREVAG